MNKNLTIDQSGQVVAPSVIGFRLADDRVVGFRDLTKITWKGLLKTGIATGIATTATVVPAPTWRWPRSSTVGCRWLVIWPR